jgi:hypothetical protein
MRLATSHRGFSVLAVMGGCLGTYAVLAIGFQSLIAPSVGHSYAAYQPPPLAVAAPASEPSSPLPSAALHDRAFAAFAAARPETLEDTPPAVAPKNAERKHAARTRQSHAARERRNPFNFVFGSYSGSRRWF